MRTAIKAGWIVGHEKGAHTLIRNGVLVYEGNKIIHVGHTFDGGVDETIDATDKLLAP
ncbi:MAG: 5-methylthioadenosine/S-adenosylhomocysteine deaminase, partial [Methylobacteriaceae bacterium]|nr:5-methylthioadenosine/S-adenosylhomocysteine deaminase [Methylobacteriaceae bacterium]